MAQIPDSTQVVVAGAGPTGLTLAALLRGAGAEVVVLDRSPRRGREARASVLHSRGIEILDGLDAAAPLLDDGERITRTAFYDTGIEVSEVRFDQLAAAFPFALGIGQNRVEAALLDRLEELGTKVRRSATVEAATDRGDGVTVEVRTANDSTHTIEAEWLVGCDGAASMLRDLIEGGAPGQEDLDAYVLASLEVGGGLDRSTMHAFSAPDGFCVVSALPGGEFRLTATMADAPASPTLEQIRALVNSRGPRAESLTFGEPSFVSRYRVRRSVARRFRSGRMLIAGDAAHTFSPVGGQGMNAGIHDAANLAWKLASICAGDAPVRLAETYESERRAAALDTFERTERLAGALTESNPVLRAARDLVGAAARVVPAIGAPLGRGLGGMDTVYSPGNYSAGAVTEGPWIDGWGRPGERMDTPVPELLADGRYHLVLTGHALMAGDVERVVDLAEGHEGGTVVHLLDPDVGGSRKGPRRCTRPWPTSDPADRPIPEHPHVVLVRPDGHIGWTGRLEDADLLGAHMDRWLARR